MLRHSHRCITETFNCRRYSQFHFEIIHQSKISKARVGRIQTPHGIINTPTFVCVGTNGTIKGVDNLHLETIGSELMFCNTYHLLIHPGTQDITDAGGLHKYINRKSPIITDSGGFQVFSLKQNSTTSEKELKGGYVRNYEKNHSMLVKKVNENGVVFRSYRDGTQFHLTPESTIQAQKAFGSDIIIPLDELLPLNVSQEKLRNSFDRTHRWEIRSLMEHQRHIHSPTTGLPQAIYCVLHGGMNKELRKESINILLRESFDGVSIGGSLGSNRNELIEILEYIMPQIQSPYYKTITTDDDSTRTILTDKPNHVLGIGDIESIGRFLPLGVDSFDSAYPTRHSRHGTVFTFEAEEEILQKIRQDNFSVLTSMPRVAFLSLRAARHSKNLSVIDTSCDCHICAGGYSVSYLHHLFKMHEPVFTYLATLHNLRFMNRMMAIYRHLILNNKI